MDRLDVILYMMGGGFTITLTFMLTMWNSINNRIDAVEHSLNARIDKLEERLTRLEHDMVEVKTILRLKESCMIKDDRQMKKAE